MTIDKKFIYAYALKNAVEHEGKAVAGSVIAGLFNHGLSKDKVKDVMKDVSDVLKEVNSWKIDKQNTEYLKYVELIGHRPERDGLAELPNVPATGVVMRFAPAASGQLHLGHVIAGIPTSEYVKKYGGKFFVRIEDTNPEKTDPDSYEGFKRDCDWLFGNVTEYIIQSDRLPIYYKYAEKLIHERACYVCTCDNEKFKILINKNKACPCRSAGIDQTCKW